jgi:putative FmdB family regulatory protein
VPTYQYACTVCGEQLEAVQKFTDDPLTECPQCQGKLRKVFSPVGIVFKGSGFYRTDSRSSSSSTAPASTTSSGDSQKPAASTSGDGAKSDSGASTPAPAATSSSSSSSSSTTTSAA